MTSPILRFKSNNESNYPEWKEKNLWNLLTGIIDFRGRTPKKLGMDWSNNKSEYLALSAVNVKMGYIDYTADPHYGDEALYHRWMDGKELYKGQVLFTTEAPMGNVTQIPDDRPYILSQRTIAFVPDKESICDDFLACVLSSPVVQNDLKVLATGGTAQGISQKSLSQLQIYYPSLPEQRKIATFLSTIDEIIATTEAEVSAWEECKKGVMQKLFSQKMRFKTDDGSDYPKWEEKKLDEVVEFLDGLRKPLEAGERIAGPYPYYGASGIIDYVENYIFDEELILLSEDGANILDRNYRVAFLAKGKYLVNNHAHVLKAIDGNVNNFICEQLESFDYRKYNSGGAQPKLNQATCRGILMQMPVVEEQQKIADCLSSFDDVINQTKAELAAWQEFKKGLLQQMFV